LPKLFSAFCVLTDNDSSENEAADESETENERGKGKEIGHSVTAPASELRCTLWILI